MGQVECHHVHNLPVTPRRGQGQHPYQPVCEEYLLQLLSINSLNNQHHSDFDLTSVTNAPALSTRMMILALCLMGVITFMMATARSLLFLESAKLAVMYPDN